jgi:4-amino-4-deoxychorismate lyase
MAFVTLPGVFYPYGIFERAEWSPEKGDPRHPEFNYTVYLDNTPIHPSIFTSYKTTKREHYNAARARANIQSRAEMKEIILFNDEGKIMEGSVCCVAFWRNGAWVMPPLSAGGLAGVDRRWLLEQGKVKEGDISRDEVKEGEYVLLTNGWMGAQLGKVTLTLPESSAKSTV